MGINWNFFADVGAVRGGGEFEEFTREGHMPKPPLYPVRGLSYRGSARSLPKLT
jgi:hypothetical protein